MIIFSKSSKSLLKLIEKILEIKKWKLDNYYYTLLLNIGCEKLNLKN